MNKVLVLLSSYNGDKYIEAQINSILNQKNVDTFVLVRDDGSTDNTVDILSRFEGEKLHWYTGENLKPAKSFMDLVKQAHNYDFDYFAFSDQDDIWLENKLSVGISKLDGQDKEKPAIYFSSSTLVNNELEKIGENYVSKILSFEESLIRNNMQGSTIILNKVLINKLNKGEISEIFMHDMWINIVSHIINAEIIIDNESHLLYRQHDNNVLGINNRNLFNEKVKSYFKDSGNGRSKMLKNINEIYYDEMNISQKRIIALLLSKQNSLLKLIKCFKYKNFWKGSFFQNLSFTIDVLFDRF